MEKTFTSEVQKIEIPKRNNQNATHVSTNTNIVRSTRQSVVPFSFKKPNENNSRSSLFQSDFVGNRGINDEKIIQTYKNILRIRSFEKLESNWNFRGASKFDVDLLEKCEFILKNLSKQPEVFPTGRNSVQFEWEEKNGNYLEFEIYQNKIVCLFEKGRESKEFDLENCAKQWKEMNELISEFYESRED
jgi:hypothetical protein